MGIGELKVFISEAIYDIDDQKTVRVIHYAIAIHFMKGSIYVVIRSSMMTLLELSQPR